MRVRRRVVGVAWTLSLVLVTQVAVAAATVPVEVLSEPGLQFSPHANGAYLAWTSNSGLRPDHFDAFAERLSGAGRIRLNPAGTQGFVGGFVPGTDRLLYQQAGDGGSDLYFFDLGDRQRTKVPGVNTAGWEWDGMASRSYVLFSRQRKAAGGWVTDVLLERRADGAVRTLGTWPAKGVTNANGSVGERYAAYTVCNDRGCWAYLYDIGHRTTSKIPSKNGRPQYAPVVDEANHRVYVVRSGDTCGANARILRLRLRDLSAAPELVVDLPRGIDVGWAMSLGPNRATGLQDLYFERVRCGTKDSNIYAVRGVAPLP